MSNPTVLQIALAVESALVAFAVVGLTYIFSIRRDIQGRQREQLLDYLVNAFHTFAKANHHPRLSEIADDVERAVADIQLLGTPKQAALARQFADDIGTLEIAELDALLNELRNSLRSELGLEPINGNIVWLRIGR